MDGALVLAGGASTRMGRDKAWLDHGGRPLLEHVIMVLASRCRPIVVAAAPGQHLPLPPLESLIRVDDPQPGAGPLVGVVAGLRWLHEAGVERAYLGSSDAVGISAAHLDYVLDRLSREAEAYDAVVPRDAAGRLHPLASAVAVAPMLARARAQLEAGRPRLRALFSGARILALDEDELPDVGALRPCNTPQEWAASRQG